MQFGTGSFAPADREDPMTTTTGAFPVPGATLYYEMRGEGPLLLLIPGGSGDVMPYSGISLGLADRFTVVAYERRGFARSPLDGAPEDGTARIATDGDDAHRLLGHLTDEPAYVFGSSSGAIVALDLMTRHPDDVRLLLPHEPPIAELIPDGDSQLEMLEGVYDTYRASGVQAAMAQFSAAVFGDDGPGGPGGPAGGEPTPEMVAMGARMQVNMPFWMEYELRSYPRYALDETALRTVAERIVPVCGRASRGQFPYRAATALGERIGRDPVEMPGGHVGYITDAAEFVPDLAGLLARA